MMMKKTVLSITLFLAISVPNFLVAQEESVSWSASYQISYDDFQEGNLSISNGNKTYMVKSGAIIELGFAMNSLQFMFTKNFNEKIANRLNRSSALLIAPDSTIADNLLKLAQFDFDLSELYARRLRKELHENKKLFSKADFFTVHFNKMMKERGERSAKTYGMTDFGSKREILNKEHETIRVAISQLSDYCFECSPPKKKRKLKK